jgi:hypothetical protein
LQFARGRSLIRPHAAERRGPCTEDSAQERPTTIHPQPHEIAVPKNKYGAIHAPH